MATEKMRILLDLPDKLIFYIVILILSTPRIFILPNAKRCRCRLCDDSRGVRTPTINSKSLHGKAL